MVCPANIAVEESGPDISRLLESTGSGHEVVITRGGLPAAKVVPIKNSAARPKAGFAKGTVLKMAHDFDAPLDDFEEHP